MQHFLQSTDLLPLWSAGTEQRLWLSMFLSAMVLLFALSWLRLPNATELPPFAQVVVELVRSVKEEAASVVPEEVPVVPLETPLAPEPINAPEKELEFVETPQPTEVSPNEQSNSLVENEVVAEPKVDWQKVSLAAVQSVLDDRSQTFSVNPNFDKKREAASETFRPSAAPVKKEIWDNVEKDYLGRTIWRNGDCYKILDNPSAVYRWVFETFERYMTYCDGSNEEYLIEFEAIPDRYQYIDDEFANGIP